MNEDNIHLFQKGGMRSHPYNVKLVTKKDSPRQSAPLPPSSLMLISATFSDISHVVPQCDFILMGLSRDAEMEIQDRARRRKTEEREGNRFSPSLDHKARRAQNQILNALPVGPPHRSLHLAPGHFSCSPCYLRLLYFNSHVTSFVGGELSISLLPRSTAHS